MPPLNQHELEEQARNAHRDATIGERIETLTPPIPGAGANTLISGALGVRDGVLATRAAAAQERDAQAHHQNAGADRAREDEVNGVATTGRSAVRAFSGIASLAGREHLEHRLGRVGGGLQLGHGLYNMNQARRNWRTDPDRANEQASSGILNSAGGALSLIGGPLGLAASTGIGLGTAGLEIANERLRETGQFGQTGIAQHRGLDPTVSDAATPNRDVTDMAVDVGLDVRRRVGHGLAGDLAGFGATGAASVAGTAFGLLNAAGLATANQGTDDIVARDQQNSHAPLARSDQSAIAEHRRQLRRRQAREQAARERAGAQLHAQIEGVHGHRDMMQPERAAANAQFTAINGSNAGSIEQRVLGMQPTMDRETWERQLAQSLR